MSDFQLDKVDIDILRELQRDSRLSVRELAARVHRSATPVFERLRRLESEGVIKGYTLNIDFEKVGRDFIVFCNVKLRRINTEIHERFAAEVAAMNEVTECYNISGQFDYLLKIQASSMKTYREFVLNVLGAMPEVYSFESTFVMDELKHDYGISI